ncbi:pentatricopeptide repeat-containing protein, mitochondrial-like protein [Cinnamomum micranthum f. kanehirae]|uniref:Pentatricopeptide repeat-containing protein, mitochondrial-like protein n=1 Tax=Cinnamomum micranthum f. kanehirae TaxID=337451 RepID=A0A3S3PFJ4_9MAGN|nr:pentatricopeptide repeat-containing protein, mitochondrial-like protein [Cinnamomum micranthum f. kanehirae]
MTKLPLLNGQRLQGREGSIEQDEYALSNALKASAALKSLRTGRRIHARVVRLGFCQFTILMTALTDLYIKCSSLLEARKLFDEMSERDVVTWTSMVVGYVRHERHEESLSLFRHMIISGISPNGYSFSGALSACAGLGYLKQGKQIHAQVIVSSISGIELILQNSLLNMYLKCQSLDSAQRLFDSMPRKGSITWNEMISGHLQWGQGEAALKFMVSMISEGIQPDDFSYAICANACAALASMRTGSQIHASVVKSGFHADTVIGNAIVDMYAKCGCVDSAKLFFHLIPSKDTFLWTAMISALGRYGRVEEALQMFERMRDSDEEDSIPAKPEHYACMVDALCRSGCLDEAIRFIEQMKLEPCIGVWSSLLNSCRMYGNVKLAELAARKLLELDPENHSNYVILSNVYAAENEWEETWKIRESMKGKNTKKEPGCSWVEVNSGIHVFLTADRSHPHISEILGTLLRLNATLKEEEC